MVHGHLHPLQRTACQGALTSHTPPPEARTCRRPPGWVCGTRPARAPILLLHRWDEPARSCRPPDCSPTRSPSTPPSVCRGASTSSCWPGIRCPAGTTPRPSTSKPDVCACCSAATVRRACSSPAADWPASSTPTAAGQAVARRAHPRGVRLGGQPDCSGASGVAPHRLLIRHEAAAPSDTSLLIPLLALSEQFAPTSHLGVLGGHNRRTITPSAMAAIDGQPLRSSTFSTREPH